MRETFTERDLEELYERCGDAVFRHCLFRVSDREIAKDMVQEVFVRFWKYSQKGESVRNSKALLYRIANNLIIDHYRTRKFNSSLEEVNERGLAGYTSEEGIIARSEVGQLYVLLERLEEKDRSIFVMRYIDELSPREIGKVLGKSENSVSVHIHRVVKKIKKITRET